MLLAIDLKGRIFGQFTVISQAESRSKGVYWLCKCTCGTRKEVRGHNLRTGTTTHCGCAPRTAHVGRQPHPRKADGIAMLAHGATLSDVAAQLGVTTTTASNWRKKAVPAAPPKRAPAPSLRRPGTYQVERRVDPGAAEVRGMGRKITVTLSAGVAAFNATMPRQARQEVPH